MLNVTVAANVAHDLIETLGWKVGNNVTYQMKPYFLEYADYVSTYDASLECQVTNVTFGLGPAHGTPEAAAAAAAAQRATIDGAMWKKWASR